MTSFVVGLVIGLAVGALGIVLVIHNNKARFEALSADMDKLRKLVAGR
jgi:uncharacterized membrane-anchored protein YhcB (DUF1043 family)